MVWQQWGGKWYDVPVNGTDEEEPEEDD